MTKKNPLISLITGGALIIVIIYLVFFIPAPAKERSVIIRILLALAAGGLAAVIPGFFSLRYKDIISASGALGVFALVYLINPATAGSDSFSITVYVHGEKGPQDAVLKNTGRVVLDLKGDRRSEMIDLRGSVTFKEIPIKFLNIKVPLTVEADVYQPAKDSLYQLAENETVYLSVVKKGLSRVRGFVVDNDLKFIQGATVRIQSVVASTDSLGRFDILIPENEQKRVQKIIVTKDGFQTWIGEVTPETNEQAEIKLTAK